SDESDERRENVPFVLVGGPPPHPPAWVSFRGAPCLPGALGARRRVVQQVDRAAQVQRGRLWVDRRRGVALVRASHARRGRQGRTRHPPPGARRGPPSTPPPAPGRRATARPPPRTACARPRATSPRPSSSPPASAAATTCPPTTTCSASSAAASTARPCSPGT